MTPPPLPPGVEGHPVAPDVHTGQPEPERDGFDLVADEQIGRTIQEIYDENKRLRGALDLAVTGLRELESTWDRDADAFAANADADDAMTADVLREAVRAVSSLLVKIRATR